MALAAAIVLLLVAGYLGHRELGSYRSYRRAKANDETDLFVYSKRRLGLRSSGVAMTFGLGIALLGWELYPPQSADGLSIYLALFATLTLGLVVVVVTDLVLTSKTARPGQLRRRIDE
ncbi:MAG: hypothetical protein KJO07_19930 [Deltaproteobacteria bacterium]|nr:hypothetical protein [Deltaproteobacteria bacterium]